MGILTGALAVLGCVPERGEDFARAHCLTGDGYYLDGAGIDGHGADMMALTPAAGSWISVYGSGEGQILMLYAPQARRAFHLRWGD